MAFDDVQFRIKNTTWYLSLRWAKKSQGAGLFFYFFIFILFEPEVW